MSAVKRFTTGRIVVLAALCSALALAPAAQATQRHHHHPRQWSNYGSTKLVLDSGAVSALQSLGITPGLVGNAFQDHGALAFPITNPFLNAFATGTIKHSGGISLTKGMTTVRLTDFWINVPAGTLSATVNGGSRVDILSLDYGQTKVHAGWGRIVIGPVGASLTSGAASALNTAFNTTAFTKGLVLGQATVRYRVG